MSCLFSKRIKKSAVAAVVLCVASALAIADTTHVVKKGETLYSLSRLYNTTVADICKANGITDGSSVQAGQKLIIPSSSSTSTKTTEKPSLQPSAAKSTNEVKIHVVQKGETWYGISRTYGIAVADLQSFNGASANTGLKAGEKLKIPMAASIVSAVASANTAKSPAATPATSAKVDVPDLKAADPRSYSSKKGDSSLVWPVKSPSVTYVNGKVSGVNLSAQKNESVTAIREGTVMFSGLYRGFGNVVFVQSKTGHIYAYTGLGSVRVNKGEYVTYGQQLGTAGVDAITEKPQVSLMVFQNGLPIDPAKAPRG